jgi:phosphocarrier protein
MVRDRSRPDETKRVGAEQLAIERRLVVTAPAGLHARPAGIFVEAVQKSGVAVQIGKSLDAMANAASILSILTLDIRVGDEVVLSAEGPTAEETLDYLAVLLTQVSNGTI